MTFFEKIQCAICGDLYPSWFEKCSHDGTAPENIGDCKFCQAHAEHHAQTVEEIKS